MINFELKLDYKTSDDDDLYREQFLNFFKIDEYDSKIIMQKQDDIYKELKNDVIFKEIIVKLKSKHSFDSDDVAYTMLYSFDYLDIFSEIVKLLISYQEKKVLYESLQKELLNLRNQL